MQVLEAPIPGTMEPQVFNDRELSFVRMLRHAVERAERVGTGSSRIAFKVGYQGRPTVFKLAYNRAGLFQNRAEIKLLKHVKSPILIPMIDYDMVNPSPRWINVEYAEPAQEQYFMQQFGISSSVFFMYVRATYAEFSELLAEIESKFARINLSQDHRGAIEYYTAEIVDIAKKTGLAVGDVAEIDNWGWYNRQLVLLDAGFTDDLWTIIRDDMLDVNNVKEIVDEVF